MTACLLVLRGHNRGAIIPLDRACCAVGRNPDNHVVIPVTPVSRRHAQILRVGGEYFIEDMRSRNGTSVANQYLSARRRLNNHDRIRICDWIAAFLASADQALAYRSAQEKDTDAHRVPSAPVTRKVPPALASAGATLDALFVALERTPDDWVARAALADCYEEAGLLTTAACLRWMLDRRIRPSLSFGGGAYWFNGGHSYVAYTDRHAYLPGPVFAALSTRPNYDHFAAFYGSPRDAEEDLFAAFAAALAEGTWPPA
jgi:hypothetical protein